ncbi:MAG TPA: DEAD/DEAH box helicase [Clostridiaceae bacterium]|nr:DEAD/DEAH box helicase [Clostridiaceae bacterium]
MSDNISGTLRGLHEHSLVSLRRFQGIVHDEINDMLANTTEGNQEVPSDTTVRSRALILEASLSLPAYASEMASLKLRIGTLKHLYKVRTIEGLLQAYDNNTTLYFGKALNFKRENYVFDSASQELMNWLLFLYYNDREKTSYSWQPTTAIFSGDKMILNSARLYQFFKLCLKTKNKLNLQIVMPDQNKNRKQTASKGNNKPFQIVEGWPAVYFELESTVWQESPHPDIPIYTVVAKDETTEKTVSICRATTWNKQGYDLRLLANDSSMLMSQDTVFLTPNEPLRRAFFSALGSIHDQNPLVFSTHEVIHLLHLVWPNFGKKGIFRLAPELQNKLDAPDLTTVLWLDQVSGTITAKIEFHYGDTIINPHPDLKPPQPSYPVAEETWLVRDLPSEKQVLKSLSDSGFRDVPPLKLKRSKNLKNQLEKGLYFLFGDRQIFVFLKHVLPAISENITVYYSDHFKQIRVRPVPSLKGHLHLTDRSDLLSIELQADDLDSEAIQEILQAYREKRHFTRLKNGTFIDLNTTSDMIASWNRMEKINQLGGKWKNGTFVTAAYRVPAVFDLLADDKQAGKTNFFTMDTATQQLMENVKEPAKLDFTVPTTVDAILRPYQMTGFKWLCSLSHYGFGGILADEMGLGKTLQSLAFLSYYIQENPITSLVIAPTSLIYNWQSEAARFTPDLNAMVVDGTKEHRLKLYDNMAAYDLIIMSYAVARQDINELTQMKFGVCILDEAQAIKNPLTQTARAVKSIPARRRFALTGTPIENTLSELWSIFDFLMPGYLFRHRDFQTQFEQPILRDNNKQAMHSLKRLISPFIMRRLKKDVLKELPDKIETQLLCKMTPEQFDLYRAYLAQARQSFSEFVNEGEPNRHQVEILSLLTRLRQICCHPAMFLENYTGSSGKLDALNDLLENLFADNHRVLLFSQFTTMLNIIRDEQTEKGNDPFYIDGSVASQERMDQVDRFNRGEGKLFLISLRAGGTGLNLTGADVVIHFDPWWNPAVEQQATDRAHRIGQQNVVQIFRLIARDSIEEKILKLKARKSDLIHSVIQANQNPLVHLSKEELFSLFE